MRLTEKEKEAIIASVANYLPSVYSELNLYLFGSRAKDHQKGGDIDLLLVVHANEEVQRWRDDKVSILQAIKKQIGDQRIDLKISSKADLRSDVFLKAIFESCILLKTWPSSRR